MAIDKILDGEAAKSVREKLNRALAWGDHAGAGYLKPASLKGYATESWVKQQDQAVRDWVLAKAYLTIEALEGYATEGWVKDQDQAVRDWVLAKAYLTIEALKGYATESWVKDQDQLVRDWVLAKAYLTIEALEGYAKEDWVKDQKYLTAADLPSHQGLATEEWVKLQIEGFRPPGRQTIPFTELVSLDQDYRSVHQVSGPITYTLEAETDHTLGSRIDHLEADGINQPAFDPDAFHIAWGNFKNEPGVQHRLFFEYGKDKVDVYMTYKL